MLGRGGGGRLTSVSCLEDASGQVAPAGGVGAASTFGAAVLLR